MIKLSRVETVSFFHRRKVFKSREILSVFPTFKTAQPGKRLATQAQMLYLEVSQILLAKKSPVAVEYEVTL